MAVRKVAAGVDPTSASARTLTAPQSTADPKKGRPDAARKKALLDLANSRFKVASEAESLLRQEQLTDKRFRAGQQWDEDVKRKRKKAQRPSLTINRIPQFVKQITGAQRANRQDIEVLAVDDEGDPKVADIFSGLIKHIESISHAEDAYDTAGDDQVVMGRGYFRLVTEPCYDDSFDLEIKIKRIRNAHSVYYDPRCQELDYSDAMYAFVCSDYALEEFKYQFGKDADIADIENDDAWRGALGDNISLWWDGTTIRVAEYFYVEYEDYILCRLSDGRDMAEEDATQACLEDMKEIAAVVAAAERAAAMGQPIDPSSIPQPLEIVRKRPAKRRVVKWAKICGQQVLKEGRWPGKWIPIIPVLGDEIDLDGKVDYRGIVRDARDQQRLYNFHVSSLVEAVGMAPRAPWVIAAGQLEGFEKLWKSANTEPHAYLPYKLLGANGQYAPAPQRQTFEPAIQAIVVAIQQADNDFKATTGFYDASLGERGPEQSGKAILARQKQGEIGSVHFATNMSRARWACGRQLIDVIPKVYDVARVVRITGNDGKQKKAMVHGGREDSIPQALPEGIKEVYDLSVGRFDIRVAEGPSNTTRRQESVEMMTAAIQSNPELLQLIGDLYFGAMDDPKMRQIAERLKRALPAAAQDEDGEVDPERLKAIVAQQKQQMGEMQKALEEQADVIRTKQIEANSRIEQTWAKGQVDTMLARSKGEIDAMLAKLQAALDDAADARSAVRGDVSAARADQRKDASTAKTENRRIAADALHHQRDIDHQQDTHARDLGAQHADTIFKAQLGRMDANRQDARAARERQESRVDAREQNQFALALEEKRMANAPQKRAGAGATPAAKKPTQKPQRGRR